MWLVCDHPRLSVGSIGKTPGVASNYPGEPHGNGLGGTVRSTLHKIELGAWSFEKPNPSGQVYICQLVFGLWSPEVECWIN
jgi:hypothetical protein